MRPRVMSVPGLHGRVTQLAVGEGRSPIRLLPSLAGFVAVDAQLGLTEWRRTEACASALTTESSPRSAATRSSAPTA